MKTREKLHPQGQGASWVVNVRMCPQGLGAQHRLPGPALRVPFIIKLPPRASFLRSLTCSDESLNPRWLGSLEFVTSCSGGLGTLEPCDWQPLEASALHLWGLSFGETASELNSRTPGWGWTVKLKWNPH